MESGTNYAENRAIFRMNCCSIRKWFFAQNRNPYFIKPQLLANVNYFYARIIDHKDNESVTANFTVIQKLYLVRNFNSDKF